MRRTLDLAARLCPVFRLSSGGDDLIAPGLQAPYTPVNLLIAVPESLICLVLRLPHNNPPGISLCHLLLFFLLPVRSFAVSPLPGTKRAPPPPIRSGTPVFSPGHRFFRYTPGCHPSAIVPGPPSCTAGYTLLTCLIRLQKDSQENVLLSVLHGSNNPAIP